MDDREVRVYRTNGSYASAIFADDLSSPFGYITEALQRSVQLRPQRVLVIGGAGFTYPYQLAQESTTIQHIDVVDVDPAVLEVAEEQFLRTDLPDIVHFHAQPARFFLTQQHEPYDIIFVDAFYGKAIPGQLTTVEFFQDTQEMLAPDGVLMMNAILDEDLDSNLSLHLLGSMQHVFTDIRSLSTSEKKSTRTADAIGNIMLTTRPLHASYARTQASPLVYTDDRRTTERDTVELYW